MAKCNINKLAAQKLGYKTLDRSAEVDFTIKEDIDACVKINTRKFIETTNSGAYSKTTKPEDMINPCGGFGCKTTGTLFITSKDETGEGETPQTVHTSIGKFSTISDATSYAGGIVYFYVNVPAEGEYTVTVKLSDISDEAQDNADIYTTTLSANASGFYPVSISLAQAPQEMSGEGWQESQSGTVISIEVSKTDESAESIQIGLSTIMFFDGLEDLEGNIVVKLGCLTGIDGDDTIDALDDTCTQAGYDPSSTEVSSDLNFSTWTPNALELNPLLQRGDVTDGFIIERVSRTIELDGDYGVITIADAYAEECGFVYVALNDDCNVTDSVFKRVNMPTLVDLNERQFQLVNSSTNPSVDFVGTKVYFNKDLVGKDVFISYPQQVEVEEHYYATDENLNGKKVEMTYVKEREDGVKEIHIYRNVLITSFPRALSNENNEKSLSLTVKKGANGHYYDIYIVSSAS